MCTTLAMNCVYKDDDILQDSLSEKDGERKICVPWPETQLDGHVTPILCLNF